MFTMIVKRENDNLCELKCADCTNCNGNRCELHNRYINRAYNKCANHQDYRITNPMFRKDCK